MLRATFPAWSCVPSSQVVAMYLGAGGQSVDSKIAGKGHPGSPIFSHQQLRGSELIRTYSGSLFGWREAERAGAPSF